MVAPIIGVLAGGAARSAATRVGAGSLGQSAAQFGGSALATGAANRRQPRSQAGRPRGWDAGATRWARDNPGEFAIAAGVTSIRTMSTPTLAHAGASVIDSVVSPQQFGRPGAH